MICNIPKLLKNIVSVLFGTNLLEVGLRVWREGLRLSLVPVRELPLRPLMVVVVGVKVARDAIASIKTEALTN